MLARGRVGEDPFVFTCTPMHRSLCVCDCGVRFFFFFNKYYCDSVKDAVCGWGDEESGGQLRQEVLAQVHRKNGP